MPEGSEGLSHMYVDSWRKKILDGGLEVWEGSMSGMFQELGGGPCSCRGGSEGGEKWELRSERHVVVEGVYHVGPPWSF